MKNPLIKRLPREFKSEIGKYLVLFIFITGMIGIVSGFLVASNSMTVAYNESFEKYHIEDGNFELAYEANEELIETLEDNEQRIYENFYLEEQTNEFDSTVRIFQERKDINLVCLMSGEMPTAKDEIALDRLYATNNKIEVGDTIRIGKKNLTVTGLVALSDYSALYSSPSDMMFDSVKFGVAIMTEDGFDSYPTNHLHYNYSWVYDESPENDTDAKERAEDFLEHLTEHAIVTNYIPAYGNQAIHFTGNDIGRDNLMVTVFLYLLIIIIAFIFAITTSNTITKEATVIGTLRASGYSRGELMRHYLTIPISITLIAALVGNILGYTIVKDFAADLYYASYCLPTYITLWNADAFVKTTIIPVILMLIINWTILVNKLSLSPLKFLRRDLKRKQKKKAFRLNTKIGIMKRFLLRIIFQNMPNYITIIIGIFMANVILLFGFAMPPMMTHYQEEITNNMISKYQYALKAPVETDSEDAEKYCMTSLKTIEGRLRSEQAVVYGITEDSDYLDLDFQNDGVYISNAYAEKHHIDIGDRITLDAEYGNDSYEFSVQGIHYYPSSIAIFMDEEAFRDTFDWEEDEYTGYFSNEELNDIDDAYIATTITEDDLTKTSRQLMLSMGGLMDVFAGFGIVMFMLIIYLLSKIIIEKNAQSISMTKILGYTNREINSLYVMATSLVVIGSFILTLPIVNIAIKYVFAIAFSEYSGWLPYYVPFPIFVKIVLCGICAYAIIAFLQMRKVKKVPLEMALKNVE